MAKTGIGLLEILALIAILLPLIPVFFIFIQKSYKQDVFNLLMVLCIITFIQNLLFFIPGIYSGDFLFMTATFQLIDFIILVILLKRVITGRWIHESMKILLVSFVSVVITLYSLQKIQIYFNSIELVQAVLLMAITLIALFQLIMSQDIRIFLSPLFWIAAGTFFYYTMFFITQSLPEYNPTVSGIPYQQKKILLLIIILIQYIFYTIAVKVSGNKKTENDL